MKCFHKRTRMMRNITRDNRNQIEEVCQDCGGNARGPGVWVPQSAIPQRVEDLPVHRDHRPAEVKGEQPSLFGDLS